MLGTAPASLQPPPVIKLLSISTILHQVDGEDTRQELRASHNPRGWVRVDLLGQADFDASGKYIHLDAGYGDLFANSRQSRKDMPGQSRRGVGGVPAWWWQIGARRSCGTGARIPGMKGASLLGMKAGSGFVTTTTPTLPRTRPLPVVRRLYGIGEDLSLQERICTNCCVDTTRS